MAKKQVMTAHAALQVLAPLLEFAATGNDREPLSQTEQEVVSALACLPQHNSMDLTRPFCLPNLVWKDSVVPFYNRAEIRFSRVVRVVLWSSLVCDWLKHGCSIPLTEYLQE